MLFDKGKLEKLTLRAFKSVSSAEGLPASSNESNDTYVVQVNPGTYTLNKNINYSRHTGQGDTATEALYRNTPPANLSFEFLFDGTGVVPEPSEVGDIPLVGAIASAFSGPKKFEVTEEIGKFDRLVYEFDGKIHRPRELLLVWGTRDRMIPNSGARVMLGELPATRVELIEGCGRHPQLEAAEELVELLIQFPA